MILLLESESGVRKKLSDLLPRERIIGVGNKQQILEALVRHRNKFNLIIADIRLLKEVLSEQTILKLCKKLSITMPPIVGFFKEGDKKLKNFKETREEYKIIKYDEQDHKFPSEYIKAIKDVYSELNVDINKANEVWLKGSETQDLLDVQSWLKDEGFIKKARKAKTPRKEKSIEKEPEEEIHDYKKAYFEIKKKYDELLKYVKELTDLT